MTLADRLAGRFEPSAVPPGYDLFDPEALGVLSDLFEEADNLLMARALRDPVLAPVPPRGQDWRDHVITLEPDGHEQALVYPLYGDTLGFSPALVAAADHLRLVGGYCSGGGHHLAPGLRGSEPWTQLRDRNRLHWKAGTARPGAAAWRDDAATALIGQARVGHSDGRVALACRDFLLLLGHDDLARQAQELVVARTEGALWNRAYDAEVARRKQAAKDAAEAPLVAAAAKLAGSSGWSPADVADLAGVAAGYDAKLAARLLAYPGVKLAVIGAAAPTRCGWRIVKKSPVLYYRKSSSGRWGRSAKTCYVLPAVVAADYEATGAATGAAGVGGA